MAKNGSAYFFGSGPHVSYPFTVLIFTLHTLLRWTSTLNQFVKMFSISPSASSSTVAQCIKMGKKCNFGMSPVGRIGQILTRNSEERSRSVFAQPEPFHFIPEQIMSTTIPHCFLLTVLGTCGKGVQFYSTSHIFL